MSHRLFSKVLGFFGYTVQYGCIAHCTFEYIGEFVVCSGPSMEPTITNHDVVFSERLSRHAYRIENIPIPPFIKIMVQSNFLSTQEVTSLKSFPAHTVKIVIHSAAKNASRKARDKLRREIEQKKKLKHQKGDIVIAKSPFDPHMNICKRVIGLEGDKVCTSSPSDTFKTHTFVPRGHVWLEGDNLQNSTDSRSYGPVPYGLIQGRVCLKVSTCIHEFSWAIIAHQMNPGPHLVAAVASTQCWHAEREPQRRTHFAH